ncbi:MULTISPECIES: M3 family metallopeptidase [unclassified Tenacibaculum]|uniref:M3 family metallopeptidase n=1 Tax=unclassified Tenacibaculum TaxID=2635139 RepID=UPI001F413569|nr:MULTISPECIES: M3 family metallopeptidase [unclassified Tenacibaculum]MCF2873516.1 M3 family metallopeptidase [Tenacibaculum sp. Cn5-1]MCF2933672.1 M3 family metallopeptidase [Tenacibaculum sp. Cn5-34]MCG7509746.1 M3 family metallopeptidase [Tenacibaculum sp. Cn5-46]
MTKNPLLQDFNTAPFSKINTDHYKPAIKKAIELARDEINAIAENPEKATFQNTTEALDYTGEKLDRVTSIFFNLNSAETNAAIQEIAKDISPWLSEFKNDMILNETLFNRVKVIYDQKDSLELTPEQTMLLEKQYKGFSRNGANLNENEKTELRKLDAELAKLSLQFGENVLAETNAFEMHLINEEDVKGLPESAKEAAKELAKSKEKEGWLITLDYPSYIPFMTYADNRELRKKLAIAMGKKGFQKNDFNNEEIVLKIVTLRHKRANLLGYKTHAHFVLEERMAENPEKVLDFLNELLEKAKPAAKKEFENLETYAKKLDNVDQLQKWDSAYYSEKLKKELFSLDQELLKPYFKLENVIDGVFEISGKLFDLQFEEIDSIDKYHEDVKTYAVSDSKGNFISHLYADFHPRPGKRNGAWMTSYKSQQIKKGVNERPQVSIVCNFTKPTETKPSLLTFNEVTTLFHEFGHALHGMLANTTYNSLSGTSVSWDFVELPSQVLENWCYEKEALELFAKHYETGETIPMEYVTKIKESASFHEGMQTLRQLSFGLLDMSWHGGTSPQNISSVKDFETKAFSETQLYPNVAENCMSTAFSHIFQGGYSAGYYSYKWAEVLDADAFEYFLEKGIFDKEVANKFKDNVLSKGGTEKPMDLYVRFRGKEPKPDALLKRAGLI